MKLFCYGSLWDCRIFRRSENELQRNHSGGRERQPNEN